MKCNWLRFACSSSQLRGTALYLFAASFFILYQHSCRNQARWKWIPAKFNRVSRASHMHMTWGTPVGSESLKMGRFLVIRSARRRGRASQQLGAFLENVSFRQTSKLEGVGRIGDTRVTDAGWRTDRDYDDEPFHVPLLHFMIHQYKATIHDWTKGGF